MGHVYWRAPCLVKPLTQYFFLILHPPQQYLTPEPLSAVSLWDGLLSMTQRAGPFQTFLPWQNLIWFARHRIHILLSLPDSGSWVPWTKVIFEATNYHSSNSSSHSLLILPSFFMKSPQTVQCTWMEALCSWGSGLVAFPASLWTSPPAASSSRFVSSSKVQTRLFYLCSTFQ